MSLPMMAARLAGGFLRPVDEDALLPLIREALEQESLEELGAVASLPGTPRAVLGALGTVWREGAALLYDGPRAADLMRVERFVRESLPPGMLPPPNLARAARERALFAPSILGSIVLEGVVEVAPVWRDLLNDLADITSWTGTAHGCRDWFRGYTRPRPPTECVVALPELCADPRSEVVEALRWLRALLSSGNVQAAEVGITAPSPATWDEHFLVLAGEADLPLHFSHGIPALATGEGQACAALADILLRGLSQDRVRRLVRRLPRTPLLDALPADWAAGLPRGAALASLDHWCAAVAAAASSRTTGESAANALLPVLVLLARGAASAAEAGERLLSSGSLALWRRALNAAPAAALELSLQSLRVSDGREAGACAVWGPSRHFAASPRAHMRLIGLAGRSWPRRDDDDPIIPAHLWREGRALGTAERDRLDFSIISDQARSLVLSRSRRNAAGLLLSPSPLWTAGETVLGRGRIPLHAFSETDRLFARPKEAVERPRIALTATCWANRKSADQHTVHDGQIRADHPVIEAALSAPHSISALERLLLDPLGYVWERALGWRALPLEPQPLGLSPRTFGEMVHALISETLRALSASGPRLPGEAPRESALATSCAAMEDSWPLRRPVPPPLLWRHLIGEAASRARRALEEDNPDAKSAQTWTEIAFGGDTQIPGLPWISPGAVSIGDTGLHLRGRIDRLDLAAHGRTAVLTEYKSGPAPAHAGRVVFGRGAELQRVFYALAVSSLLPEAQRIVSRLMYLGEGAQAFAIPEEAFGKALADAASFTAAAAETLRSGKIAPGEESRFHDDLWLALPADRQAYRASKQRAFAAANGTLRRYWGLA
ncbi:PD-(D/E)XK nuclease family protein [uncultured Enterovirga sp.]|uniref:PD-(D/E)XK nuclease family protein n=1 Tax=uncultured Enterovirga sp. TaxID=2026352 RepID=UPI0035CC592D